MRSSYEGQNDSYVRSVVKKALSGKFTTDQAAARLGTSKQCLNHLKMVLLEKKGGKTSSSTEVLASYERRKANTGTGIKKCLGKNMSGVTKILCK